MPHSSTRATGPLSGVRVVEQGTFITGPFASMMLADMGAEVIKVERPDGGDPFRQHDGTDYASTFQSVNRNKRSIAIDLRDENDRETLHDLVRSADVYLHNFRPDAAVRMGIHSEALLELNPRLIYCGISGLGSTGPYAKRPAYDTVAQSLSGMLSMTLDPVDPRISGPANADAVTSLYAAQGILAALYQRERDGLGHVVELSMLESMVHFLAEPFAGYFAKEIAPGPYTRAATSQSFALRCADDHVLAIHLSSPVKFWESLLAVTGLERLADDPRFLRFTDRRANHEPLRQELQKVFSAETRDVWFARLLENDVPSAPVLDLAGVAADPQFRHLEIELTAEHPVKGTVRSLRSPFTFDGVVMSEFTPPPTIGEHSDEIRMLLRSDKRLNEVLSATEKPTQ